MRVQRTAFAAILLLSAIAGCSASSDAGTGSALPPAGSTAKSDVGDLVSLRKGAGEAQLKVARTCMEDQGFTIHPVQKPPPNIPDQIPATYAPRISADQASAHGYGIGDSIRDPAPPPVKTPADDPFSQLPESEQDRYHAAWGEPRRFTLPTGEIVGLAVGGCFEQATKDLFGDVNDFLRLQAIADNDENTALAEAEVDPAVTRSVQQWSQCMQQAGYADLPDVESTIQTAMRYYAPPGVVPTFSTSAQNREIELAKADAECAATTRVDEIRWQANVAHLNAYRKQHDADFVAYRQLLQDGLAKAQAVLGT